MERKFISEIIRDPSVFLPHHFNLIQAPCGAGKSAFVADNLLSLFPGVEPWEVVFITSRSITVAQQVTHYAKLCAYDNETKKFAEFWRGTSEPVDDEREYICLLTFDKIIDILRNNLVPGHNPFAKVKIIVVDECHTLVTDLFISGMELVTGQIRNTMEFTDVLVIGMTATPQVLLESVNKHGFTIHNVIDQIEPLYTAVNLVVTTWKHLPILLNSDKYGDRTIVMTTSVERAIELQRKIPHSAIVTSRHSKKWIEQDMGEIWDSLVRDETVPVECSLPVYGDNKRVQSRERGDLRVLIFTSVAREGLTIRETSGIRNVVCCFGDEMHITQFAGRCRFNYENLIVCDDQSALHSPNQYIEQQRHECHDFVYGHNDEYFKCIGHLVDHDVSAVKRCLGTDEFQLFWEYLESKWLVHDADSVPKSLVLSKSAKAEIVNEAKKYQLFKLRRDKKREPSFALLQEIIETRRPYHFVYKRYWGRMGSKTYGGFALILKDNETMVVPPADAHDANEYDEDNE